GGRGGARRGGGAPRVARLRAAFAALRPSGRPTRSPRPPGTFALERRFAPRAPMRPSSLRDHGPEPRDGRRIGMQIGIGPWGMQVPVGSGFTHEQVYRETLEQVELAEELGFDSAWLTEHHFLPCGYLPKLLPAAAALAARTRRIRIGTGVLLLPLYDPIHVAEETAVVDLLSGGRLIFGIAPGYRPEEFAGFHQVRERRGARMEEAMQILIRAWTEERF